MDIAEFSVAQRKYKNNMRITSSPVFTVTYKLCLLVWCLFCFIMERTREKEGRHSKLKLFQFTRGSCTQNAFSVASLLQRQSQLSIPKRALKQKGTRWVQDLDWPVWYLKTLHIFILHSRADIDAFSQLSVCWSLFHSFAHSQSVFFFFYGTALTFVTAIGDTFTGQLHVWY